MPRIEKCHVGDDVLTSMPRRPIGSSLVPLAHDDYLLLVADNGQIQFHDRQMQLKSVSRARLQQVDRSSIVLSPGSDHLFSTATVQRTMIVRTTHLESGLELARSTPVPGRATAMVYVPSLDSGCPESIIVATSSTRIIVFRADSLEILARVHDDTSIESMSVSSFGLLATGGDQGVIRIFKITTEKSETLTPLCDPISVAACCAVAFSPNGRLLATAGQSGSVEVFDVMSAMLDEKEDGKTSFLSPAAAIPLVGDEGGCTRIFWVSETLLFVVFGSFFSLYSLPVGRLVLRMKRDDDDNRDFVDEVTLSRIPSGWSIWGISGEFSMGLSSHHQLLMEPSSDVCDAAHIERSFF